MSFKQDLYGNFSAFFLSIKKRTGVIEPKWVMTDDASQHFSAWIKVFGEGLISFSAVGMLIVHGEVTQNLSQIES